MLHIPKDTLPPQVYISETSVKKLILGVFGKQILFFIFWGRSIHIQLLLGVLRPKRMLHDIRLIKKSFKKRAKDGVFP